MVKNYSVVLREQVFGDVWCLSKTCTPLLHGSLEDERVNPSPLSPLANWIESFFLFTVLSR